MQRSVILLAMVLAVGFAASPATAVEAGASGQCYDDDPDGDGDREGGQASVGVDSDDPTNPDAVDAAEVQSAAEAVAAFATGSTEDDGGDACDNPNTGPNGEDTRDYIEVHAAGNQVCYDSQPRTDGDCPTSPGGQGD